MSTSSHVSVAVSEEPDNMNRQSQPHRHGLDDTQCESLQVSLPDLVGQVYEEAPTAVRGRMIEHLLRPLGVLSVAVVANGIFSKIRFLSGWPEMNIRPDQLEAVRAQDVRALVEYVQQASWEVMDGLVQILSDSPVISATAGATLLVAVLLKARKDRGSAISSDL